MGCSHSVLLLLTHYRLSCLSLHIKAERSHNRPPCLSQHHHLSVTLATTLWVNTCNTGEKNIVSFSYYDTSYYIVFMQMCYIILWLYYIILYLCSYAILYHDYTILYGNTSHCFIAFYCGALLYHVI